jgi:hypothetical protein
MANPIIATLTNLQLNNLINDIENCTLSEDNKKIISDLLSFVNLLIEQLKTSKVSIHKLKQLLGFQSELLKKVNQVR